MEQSSAWGVTGNSFEKEKRRGGLFYPCYTGRGKGQYGFPIRSGTLEPTIMCFARCVKGSRRKGG